MWSRVAECDYVEEHFKLNTSSLVPGKPQVEPKYIYRYKNVRFTENGVRKIFKQWTRHIYIYFDIPSNIAKEDLNIFVSVLHFYK